MDTRRQLRDRRPLDGRRVKARLLDELLILAGLLVLVVAFGGISGGGYLVVLALQVSYFFVCEATWGYTYGKYRMGLRVIRPDGTAPGAGSIAARNILRVVEEPFIALLVMAATGGRRQRVGDLIGTTAVGSLVFSERPQPSRMRVVYPAIWIAGAIATIMLIADPHERYLNEVNRTCAVAAAGGQVGTLNLRTLPVFVRNGRRTTEAMAAIDPPAVDRDRHDEIVSLLRHMDGLAAQMLKAVRASGDPASTLRIEFARFQSAWQQVGYRLHGLGLTCRI